MDLEGLRHVAQLAELSLTPEEEARLGTEIGRILAHVAELDAVDTTDVPPTAHVTGVTPEASGEGWRPDAVLPCLPHDEVLAGAPEALAGGFAVPGFVD